MTEVTDMKYAFYGEQIPKEQRGELNEKVLYLIDSGTADASGITQEDMCLQAIEPIPHFLLRKK